MSTLDEVISTVIQAREDGPDALAAVAMSFGATRVLGTVRNRALRGQIAEMRAAMEATEATVATLRDERDAASAAAKAARQRMEEVREQCDRARDDAEMCARQRDEARASMLAQDLARDEVWKLRESVEALRARAERAEAERDESMAAHDHTRAQWATVCRERDGAREALATAGKIPVQAVREREAFSLRLSAAERERDEAREALDISRESAREAREEIAGALALVDEARARVEAIAVERNAIISELSQTTDAMMQARAERDAAIARPTYEARTVAPTIAEREPHQAAGGAWLVCRIDSDGKLHADVLIGWHGWRWEGYFFVALDAQRLPCAWPVVPTPEAP